MKYEELKQRLDDFTLKQSKKKLLSRKEFVYQFGKRFDDGDGFRYLWPEPVGILIRRIISESQSLIVYSGQVIFLKLWKDRISFSIPSSTIPKNLPDNLSEIMDNTQSNTTLSKFDEFEINRIP